MKYFAILKDSLREAIDAKVFYVMVGLSLLVTLLTATLSFKPRSGEKLMEFMAVSLYGDGLEDLRPERLAELSREAAFKAYEVKGAMPLDGAPEGPDSPYLITLVAHCKTDEEAAKLRISPGETAERVKQKFGAIDELRVLDVSDVRLAPSESALVPKSPDAKDVYFEVTARPTATARRLWPHEPSLFFGALPLSFLQEAPLGFQLYLLEDTVINGLGAWIAVLASIIITAFFIPNMLRKGTIDLLLVKPIYRSTLLLYKYLGGLLFIFLNTTVAVVGVWVALGLRSGIWAPGFLITIFVISFFFAILYAVSTLFAVLTRSPVAAILLTCGVWFLLYIVGVLFQFGENIRQGEERRAAAAATAAEKGLDKEPVKTAVPEGGDDKTPEKGNRRRNRDDQEMPFKSDNWFFNTVRAVHFVLPRAKDLDHLMSQLLIRDLLTANQVKAQKIDQTRISWGESLGVSGAFIGLMLGLACWRFATKDY